MNYLIRSFLVPLLLVLFLPDLPPFPHQVAYLLGDDLGGGHHFGGGRRLWSWIWVGSIILLLLGRGVSIPGIVVVVIIIIIIIIRIRELIYCP